MWFADTSNRNLKTDTDQQLDAGLLHAILELLVYVVCR